jgi:hypothetical protein
VPVREKVDIVVEIGKQNVLSEIFQFFASISRQPVLNDLFFTFHLE